ncbi:WXG100 family type VII secretion target [Georgenia satyanarayanai]|uniref:WXG100 family type VII secretion target n=1 Tax=Georgenia satyanarayanai TaxID=860221 RepID=UPI0012659327|nr:WXG100 family type VII secretion target [Georgenia satyanarayanai]
MGNYVTVQTREHANIGYDPCPGSPEGSTALAEQVRGFADRIDEMQTFLQGARNDLELAGWAGENRRAFQETMVEFPPRLTRVSSAFDTLQQAIRDWAGELTDFQTRSLELDAELGTAREAEAAAETARQTFLDNRTDVGWTDDDEIDQFNRLDGDLSTASENTRDVERRIGDLESEYRERAVHYGGLISTAAGDAWGGGFWASVGDVFDGIGDWVEDSFIGDFARWSAPFWDVVSEWGGWISAGLTVLGAVSLFVFPPAAPFLFGGAAIAGGAATVADGMLAASGFGGWGAVGLGLVTIGIGKGVAKAGDKIIEVYQRTGRADELINVRVGNVSGTYRPSLFTATEMHSDELWWHFVSMKGQQAEWAINGYSLSQSFVQDGEAQPVEQGYSAFEGGNPWDLPPNIAYLEDRDGELVK